MAEKACACCGQIKPLKEFYGDSRASDLRQSRCKSCFLQKGRESVKRRWAVVGPRLRNKNRMNRRNHPDRNKAHQDAYRARNPGKYAEIQRNYRESVSGRATALLNGARRRAKDKGLACSITKAWVEQKLAAGRCELTGLPFDMSSTTVNRRRPYSPSIDRISNEGGYTPENCRVVLSAINVALNEWGDDLFATLAQAFLQNRKVLNECAVPLSLHIATMKVSGLAGS